MVKNEVAPKMSGFLDRDTEFSGEIKFKENFRIDGIFKGKILSGNGLIIGESGEVEADIDVQHIAINGRVKGVLKAKDRIEIFSKGRVTGTIITPKLMIEEGGFFQGSCQMELKALESKSQSSPEKSGK